jgi:hypothetical protein
LPRAGGWTRVRVEEDGKGHILVVFRRPGNATDAGVAEFLAAHDLARRPHAELGMFRAIQVEWVDSYRVSPS